MAVDVPAGADAITDEVESAQSSYAPDPADRIEVTAAATDRTFEIALAIVAVIYLTALSASMHFAVSPDNDRRGQVEGPPSITVELVQFPDQNAASKFSQDGANTPPQQAQPPVPPAPQQDVQPAETPPKPEEKAPVEAQEKPAERRAAEAAVEELTAGELNTKPPDAPKKDVIDLNSVDLSLDNEAREFERQIAEMNRQRAAERAARRQTLANRSQPRVLGKAATGETSEYSKSVIAALFKTKPLAYTKRGEAVVGFAISRSGAIRGLRLVRTSGDSDMDTIALNAIRRAKFDPPPPGTPDSDLMYVITYVFD